jgi:hypothetical protein
VVALVFLCIGLICALIGRILLIGAAFGVSVWWGLGVFLPFGPLLFRLSYPDLAASSRYFRLAVLPCVLGYVYLQPNAFSTIRRGEFLRSAQEPAAPANHYGTEKNRTRTSLEQRRLDNNQEFRRLAEWSEALRLKKRDLLHSDVQGNIAYNAEVAQYNEALAKATTEKNAVFGSKK